MYKSRINLILVTILFFAGAVHVFGQTVAPAGSEGRLIAVLKSKDASYKEKVDACRQLAIIGTRASVPVLAGLLADEKLSHMARYAMEPIDDVSVDIAFHDALGKLRGKPLVGLIGSIGVRGRGQGVAEKLIDLLDDPDPEVAQAAARALGSISGRSRPVIVKGLTDALANATGDNKLAVCEGLFRCAESFAAHGDKDEAVRIYERLMKLDGPHQVRAGALRGALLAGDTRDALSLLKRQLRNEDYIMFSAAVQTAQEMTGSQVTKVLTDALDGLPADNKILIFQTLGKRGDPAASAALARAAQSGPKPVRIAAVEALAEIGDASVTGPLASLLADSDDDVAKAARGAFASVPGKAADAAVMKMLADSDTDVQLRALELMGLRRMTGATDVLLKVATGDNDESVRTAAIRTLGDLGDSVEIGVLLELLLNASGRQEILAAERAVSTACSRQARFTDGRIVIRKAVYGAAGTGGSVDVTRKVAKIVGGGSASITASNSNFGDPAPGIVKQLRLDYSIDGVPMSRTIAENETVTLVATTTPKAVIDQLTAALAKASTLQKIALLRILRNTQDPEALRCVRAATSSSDSEVAAEAVSLLCGWPTAEALGDVLQLAETAADPKTRIIALRGAIRLIPLQDVPVAKKLESFRRILPLVKRNEDRRLLLGALGAVNSPAAFGMILPHLDNAATQAEAATAVVGIAESILKRRSVTRRQAAGLIDALEKVATVENAALARRARALLKQAKNKARQ